MNNSTEMKNRRAILFNGNYRIIVDGNEEGYQYTLSKDDKVMYKSKTKSSAPIEMFVNKMIKDGYEVAFFSKEVEA